MVLGGDRMSNPKRTRGARGFEWRRVPELLFITVGGGIAVRQLTNIFLGTMTIRTFVLLGIGLFLGMLGSIFAWRRKRSEESAGAEPGGGFTS